MGDDDKQFDATPTKLANARKEGQVVKSKDASMAVSLLAMFSILNGMAPHIWEQLAKMFKLIYEQIPNQHIEDVGVLYIMAISAVPMLVILAPLLLLAAFVAILSDFAQVGPLVTTKPLTPKLDKINPVKGIKNIFSSRTIVELLKNVVKVSMMLFIGYMVFTDHLPTILMLGGTDNIFNLMAEIGETIMDFVTKAGIAFIVVAGADYLYQRSKFLKDQKMSMKEIKDEYKNSEGDPHVKAALRQKRMQMLQQDMLDAVSTADVITTNPVHIAVAIKYDKEQMQAPRVVAKGTELFAKKIVEIAKAHNIPIVENVPVARALYRLVDINREVPPELYKAVAEILIFVYNLKNKRQTRLS